ncbi:MAG: SBBP repeat-containing protein [Chloroflexi bacterium]|nr:SBBP repeat-containing protein [Chloroflexota bacterium]
MRTKFGTKWLHALVCASLLFALATSAAYAQSASAPQALQFMSLGHALGFASDGYSVSAGAHDLQVQFLGAQDVQPTASSSSSLAQVRYAGLWKGIDVVYDTPAGGILRSTYQLAPGADPAAIRLRYNAPLSIGPAGDLLVAFGSGQISESAPIAWQQIDGRRVDVEVRFQLKGTRDVGFILGNYDPAYGLTIDPITRWNTFLGGSGDEISASMVRDAGGNLFVAGSSDDTWETPVRPFGGSYDGYVAKLDPNGNLLWNTFLGDASDDYIYGLALDVDGNVYVTGEAGSAFTCAPTPCTISPYEDVDSFTAKLDGAGNLVWITFSGGTGAETGTGIAVDSSGNVFVVGSSGSTWGLPESPFAGGNSDAFAAIYDTNGNLVWNTFLGGAGADYGTGIAFNSNGDAFVSGYSDDTWGTPEQSHSGVDDGFAAQLDSIGNLVWNTFLGGSGADTAASILVDGTGSLYLTGVSSDPWGTPVRGYTAMDDGFTAKLDEASGALTWNTFQGGNDNDASTQLARDSSGNLYVTGDSSAAWGSPVQSYAGGTSDCFLAKLNASGGLLINSHLGSSLSDQCSGAAVDTEGNVYMLGRSNTSWGSPIRPYTTNPGNNYETFVAMVDIIAPTVVSFTRQTPSATPTNADTLVFRATFSEGMSGVGIADFAANGTTAGITTVSPVSTGVYDVTISGGDLASLNGTVGLDFSAAPVLSDSAGNPFIKAEPATDQTYTLDNIAPGVSIDAPTPPNPTTSTSATFNFSSTDGTAALTCDLDNTGFSSCSSPKNYTNLADGSHTFTARATDAAGNSSTATHTWRVDLNPPAVQSITRASPNPSSAASVNFTVTFNEIVTGVNNQDFTLFTSGVINASVTSVSGSGTTYTVAVNTGAGDGTIRLDVTDNDSILDEVSRPLGGAGAGNGNFTAGETYTISKDNPPTAVNLSSTAVTENLPAGTTVGTFSTTDLDAGETFTYSLVSGAGSDNNSAFTLTGNTLKTAQPFNYLTKNSYTIRVRSTDSTSLSYETAIVITVTDTPPIFSDVPNTFWAVSYIERLYNNGITGGCGTSPLRYCPTTNVNRAQMAVFLLKSMHGVAYTPPPATGTVFTDVPLGHWAGSWIEQLAAEGITGGCGGNNYCPNSYVTREQMAIFLLLAKHGSSYTPPPATGVFADVPANYWAAPWIEQLAAEGITGGCGGGNFCPKTIVNRAQMAVFMISTFNLP